MIVGKGLFSKEPFSSKVVFLFIENNWSVPIMQLNANEFKYTDLTETNRNVY